MLARVIKRNGAVVPFDKSRIQIAIEKAFNAVDGTVDDKYKRLAREIANDISKENEEALSVEDIQDIVEEKLMSRSRKDVARAYIRYRYSRELVRRSNTTDTEIKTLLGGTNDYWNNENANKNAKVVSTQRDYIAGITSTDITRRLLLPEDVVKAHDEGIIHFHDMDYFSQRSLHNCFSRDTKFVCSRGLVSFEDFEDGDLVCVPTHTGEWKSATVHSYGVQDLYKITLKRFGQQNPVVVYATRNHRWILLDESITEHLKIGDKLIKTPDLHSIDWGTATIDQKQLWCKGFAYGDSCCRLEGKSCIVRLCGRKNEFASRFIECGYTCTQPPSYGGDHVAYLPQYAKEVPTMTPEDTKYFTHGLLSANGDRPTDLNITGESQNKDVVNLLYVSGYWISSYDDFTGETTNYRFQADQENTHWSVVSIEPERQDTVWCLNVEDNHSFILEHGIVAGNCELVNLEDMLQNGTVLNGVKIDKPHRLITAATIASQIVLGVSSSSYGGCTISLTHLAPFVRDSYEVYKKRFKESLPELTDAQVEKLSKDALEKEVNDACQTLNYQVNSMMSINGQAPFLSVCLYIGETKEYRKELVMLIVETLKQRMQGFKNEAGAWISPAFPKLLYILDEDNATPDSEYWWVTELAAQCSAKRMVPDYISAKIMRECKINKFGVGDIYPCMGCVKGDSKINVKYNTAVMLLTFERLWDMLLRKYPANQQHEGVPDNVYIDTSAVDLQVYDSINGFVPVKRVFRNHMSQWVHIELCDENATTLDCTLDHPLIKSDLTRVKAGLLDVDDRLILGTIPTTIRNITHYVESAYAFDLETISDRFEVNSILSGNCRSFLTPWRTKDDPSKSLNYVEDEGKYYGRFNQGVITLSLPDVALSSGRSTKRFWAILNERLELCHKALRIRHERLLQGNSDMAPILWQHGALARLPKHSSIEPLLTDGYSTISLGYAGLYECVKYMTGTSHTKEGKDFGIRVMKKLNEACAKWKKDENIDYSVYGTPIESTTYKFAKCLKKRFGDDVFVKMNGKDRNYITNSYHVPVFEEIDPYEKLKLEAEFQRLSPGGAVSYVECADLTTNINVVLSLIQYIYNNIMYAELNTKSDYCSKCGYDGEIKIIDKNGTLDWQCPNCGNEDHATMHVCRRTCGYIGTNYFNQGRTDEIANRYVHIDDKPVKI